MQRSGWEERASVDSSPGIAWIRAGLKSLLLRLGWSLEEDFDANTHLGYSASHACVYSPVCVYAGV